MDERVSDLFGSGNAPESGSFSSASASNSSNSTHRTSKSYNVALRKASKKSKRNSKPLFSVNFKASNNAPYLPPEVRLISAQLLKPS